jgi:L-threonylcarbamoyladenylate synthase
MVYDEDIANALKTLREGGVILYPTDTIWGLGCDATNNDAVEKIFRIKSRNDSKSLIVLVDSESMLSRYVKVIPDIALSIIEVSETPVTIIYPDGKNLAPSVLAEDGTVGIRICREEFCNRLIERFRKPIVSTSANITGEASPANFKEIPDSIISAADYTVHYHREKRQRCRPSPVIKIEVNGVIKIIRE